MKQRLQQLKDYLAKLADGGLCVAFSGGVDSAVLLKAARLVCDNVHAVTAYTLFHSPAEPAEAAEAARAYGAVHHLLTPDLPDAVLQNPTDRCYLCKHALFSGLRDCADGQGLVHLLDGTNADDLGEYRPGLKALRELGVHSPLAELGITKEEVRAIAAHLGLTVAKKPSAPCLATRYPYGHPIVREKLPGIDRVEQLIRSLGVPIVRARVEGETLRLEVPPEFFHPLLEHCSSITSAVLEAGFLGATLDLEGFRSGSMDIREARKGQSGK